MTEERSLMLTNRNLKVHPCFPCREGTGISAFLKAVREALKEDENSPVLQSERRRERSRFVKSPSWTL